MNKIILLLVFICSFQVHGLVRPTFSFFNNPKPNVTCWHSVNQHFSRNSVCALGANYTTTSVTVYDGGGVPVTTLPYKFTYKCNIAISYSTYTTGQTFYWNASGVAYVGTTTSPALQVLTTTGNRVFHIDQFGGLPGTGIGPGSLFYIDGSGNDQPASLETCSAYSYTGA